MKIRYILAHAAISVVVLSLIALSAAAQNYPAPKEGTWIARDFRFHTGEVMPNCVCTTRRSASLPQSQS
jgi:hypothetical protein